MSQDVVQMVNTILHENFEVPVERLLPNAHLKNDLNLDSLDFVDMVVLLESKIKGQVQGIDFMKIQTLQDVYQLVGDLQSGPAEKA